MPSDEPAPLSCAAARSSLPSEDPEEPGLPDEFHDLQPQLLTLTCRSDCYAPQQIFTGTALNLYYDVRHPLWHKRPDWFVAAGVPRLYDEVDLRLSYVVWQDRSESTSRRGVAFTWNYQRRFGRKH